MTQIAFLPFLPFQAHSPSCKKKDLLRDESYSAEKLNDLNAL